MLIIVYILALAFLGMGIVCLVLPGTWPVAILAFMLAGGFLVLGYLHHDQGRGRHHQ